MLSKPRPKSSAGKLSAGVWLVPRRSRTVLLYSVRLRRWIVTRPGSRASPPVGSTVALPLGSPLEEAVVVALE